MSDRSIVDVGRFLQKYGLKIGEHPEFGGVSDVHAKGSLHYAPGGAAIDVTDWRPDVAPAYEGGKAIPWKQRTGELAWRAKQLGVFTEALGPGDKGHETHAHLALPGKTTLSDQQLEWLATGRTKDSSGRLTDVMPGAAPAVLANTPPTSSAKTGNTVNIYFDGKKETKDTSTFLSDYMENLGIDAGQSKPAFNPRDLLTSIFNAKTELMT